MSDDKRLNEVIRVQKRLNNFVMIDKTFLDNSELSWKAKGILAYLLSKPDNWKVIVGDVIKHATDGKASVYSGLDELRQQGYYDKIPVRSNDGRRIDHWESTVYELPKAVNPINAINTPFSLLSDFQEIENQDMGNQDIENRERNNNYINNTDLNNNQSSLVMSNKSNRQDLTDDTAQKIEAYTILIKNNISYNDLTITNPYDMRLVDEFITIIIDTLISVGKTVRIGGEDKPRALVSGQLMKLTYDDIVHVIEQFKGVTERISKKKQYILTMLYNCKMEFDSHYTNAVRSDMFGGYSHD